MSSQMSPEEFAATNKRVQQGIDRLAEGRRLKVQLRRARQGLLSPVEMEQFRRDLKRFGRDA